MKKDNYLVHGCLEGPEAGVYYRGMGEITNGVSTIITLPYYVDKLANDFTIEITCIYDENQTTTTELFVSRVKNNQFTVYGKNSEFFWTVYGNRETIEVEPLKTKVKVNGDGPYTWIKR